jgi:5'-3' exonuclease
MKVLIFDISNLMMRCLFAQKVDPTEKRFDLFKLTFLGSFTKALKQHTPDRVIWVEDSESWRKELCPEYKANRAAKREQSVVNFDVFFPVATEFFETLHKCFRNIPFIRVPRAEADDCIATIVKNKPEWDIINISSDKDFYQLFKYANYSQYDAVKHEFVQCLNPEHALLLKIITGDKSDNIAGLKRGIGPVKALKIINEDVDKWVKEENLKEKYELNTKLISFNCIPKEIELDIMKALDSFEYQEFDTKAYFKFVQMNGLVELMDNMTEFTNLIKGLK